MINAVSIINLKIIYKKLKMSFSKANGFQIKNICCIGGYVGGPTMSVIAKYCPEITINVVILTKIELKIEWNFNSLPIFEPGLANIVKKVRGRNLFLAINVRKLHKNSWCYFYIC